VSSLSSPHPLPNRQGILVCQHNQDCGKVRLFSGDNLVLIKEVINTIIEGWTRIKMRRKR
jgi:hypothetical protein